MDSQSILCTLLFSKWKKKKKSVVFSIPLSLEPHEGKDRILSIFVTSVTSIVQGISQAKKKMLQNWPGDNILQEKKKSLKLHMKSKHSSGMVANPHRCMSRTVFQKGVEILLCQCVCSYKVSSLRARVQNCFEHSAQYSDEHVAILRIIIYF